MPRRVAGLPSTSTNNWIDRVAPEARADQIFVELTERDNMLGDRRLSDTRTGKQDDVVRQRALGLSTCSWYSTVPQVVQIRQEIAFVSFQPSFGGFATEPGQKAIEVTGVRIDGLGSTREAA